MAAEETLTFVVAHEDAEEFLTDLAAALPALDLAEMLDSIDKQTPSTEDAGLMRSELARIVGVTLTGSGLVGASARVVIERIRAKKRDVHVIDKDGDEIILSGDFDLAEIVEILNRAAADVSDSSK
jgi:hypothetical protein